MAEHYSHTGLREHFSQQYTIPLLQHDHTHKYGKNQSS